MTVTPSQDRAAAARDLLAGRRVAPSILAADFSRLGEQVDEVIAAGARVIHVDVMDGHFVPPITMGPLVVEALRERVHAAGAVLDVHLMIERPERHVEDFARAGADVITIHAEATPHVDYALNAVREAGALAGLAVNPGTPLEALLAGAGQADLALVMSVNPGWGGQRFIAASVERLARVRSALPREVAVEVDGGIDAASAPRSAESGANLLVAGSAVFAAGDPAGAYRALAAAVGAS